MTVSFVHAIILHADTDRHPLLPLVDIGVKRRKP